MAEHKFNSIKALANELGISRTTLYKRAKSSGIELNGTYTDEQFNELMGVQYKVDGEHTSEQKTEQKSGQLDKDISAVLDTLTEQLSAKDEQIRQLNSRLEQAQKLVDQAQQLQLKTQLQLDNEKTKYKQLEASLDTENDSDMKPDVESEKVGFWRRIFR